MNWILRHKLLALIAVVAILFAAFYWISGDTPDEPLITPELTATGAPTADSADQQLVESLLTLRAVSLSGNIFQDPAFRSLRDFGTSIVPEPVGRSNPFAPISAGTGSSTRTVQSTPVNP